MEDDRELAEDSDELDEDSHCHPILRDLKQRNNYNPAKVELYPDEARFFVIKSYSEDDIHRSIKYEIWCSTEHGNKRLDQAFRESQALPHGSVYLFFSVNGSGHFCGAARMMSPVDYDSTSDVWAQDKWRGQFRVRWIYVKDIPNQHLRHITLENNENKPVTNSRDTQEVPLERGKQVLQVMHSYRHSTSIFDDFLHYERKQEQELHRHNTRPPPSNNYHPHKNKRGGHHHHQGNHGPPHHHGDRDHHRGGGGGGGALYGGDRDNRESRERDRDNYRGGYGDRDHHRGGYDDRDHHRSGYDDRDHHRGGYDSSVRRSKPLDHRH